MTLLKARDSKPMLGGASYSLGHRLFRAAWNIAWLLLAAWTPPPMHRWRAIVLRLFGAKVDATARVYGSARIWYPPNLTMGPHAVIGPRVNCYCMDRVELGEMAIVSQGAHLCGGTHDIRDPDFQLVTRPIVVGRSAWIAAEAFVGPGVTVGEYAVIGARAVILRDAEPYGVYTGNPAQLIKQRLLRVN
ncbi:LbetaH domain-containing protein [Lysobacter tyrosinilyticus]